ncbi:hypothetical protein [Spirosoma flavum]|uniref:Uncharacterized protein n=1 Tax=Spirosoma flavum TaxID=2048557 RepID=A0ABW6AQN8_9BACT
MTKDERKDLLKLKAFFKKTLISVEIDVVPTDPETLEKDTEFRELIMNKLPRSSAVALLFN